MLCKFIDILRSHTCDVEQQHRFWKLEINMITVGQNPVSL